jgi:hypothetical protein
MLFRAASGFGESANFVSIQPPRSSSARLIFKRNRSSRIRPNSRPETYRIAQTVSARSKSARTPGSPEGRAAIRRLQEEPS